MSCHKIKYRTQTAAIKAALRSSRRGNLPLGIYPCSECKALHLTKKVKVAR
jgi:hypothetical protein